MERKKNPSIIWTFCSKNKDNIQCNLCKHKFSISTTSTNLKRHFERKHPTVQLKQNQKPSSDRPDDPDDPVDTSIPESSKFLPSLGAGEEPTHVPTAEPLQFRTRGNLQQQLTPFLKKTLSGNQKSKIDQELLQMIVKDFQPFSIVEDRGFKSFVKSLNPNYVLPSRKTLSKTLLPAFYESKLSDLKEIFFTSNISAVTLTTDCWTSSNTESFMAITAHFIDQNFELKSYAIDCFIFEERHTSENLSQELLRVASEWQLNEKILLCVSDNAANIVKAVKECLRWRHFGCLAHTINLIVCSSLSLVEVQNLLKKIKTIVTFFKHSANASKKLEEIQRQNGMEPKKLIQDVSTRWNSSYLMIERFLNLEIPLKTAIALIGLEQLSANEWQAAKELKIILGPMLDFTKFVSGQKYVTGSSVIIVVDGIKRVYDNMQANRDITLLTSKNVIQKMIEGISTKLNNLNMSNILTISTFLDPRYKIVPFSSNQGEDIKKKVINAVANLIEKNEKPSEIYSASTNVPSETSSTIDSTSSFSFWSEFTKKAMAHKPTGTFKSRAITEVQRYLEEPLAHQDSDPLKWWKDHGYNYPFLKEVFRNKFATVITSVPCERLFSKTGQILSDRRTRLSSDNLQKIIFLNQNF